MKKQPVVAIAVSLLLHSVYAQTTELYTNATSGATVDLSADMTLSTDPASVEPEAFAVGFSGGEGTLTGTGAVTVRNIATSSDAGAATLIGITGSTITNQYTGTLQVVNDLSAFSGAGNNLGFATGIEADVSGDLAGGVNVLLKGATYLTGESVAVDFSVTAYGVNGDIDGSITEAVLVAATGGTVIDSLGGAGSATHTADSTATAIEGGVFGDILANVTASSVGGQVKANGAHGTGKAYAITGDVVGDVDSVVAASASGGELEGGLSWANGDAEAEAIGGDIVGNVTGSVVAEAVGGRAINGNDVYIESSATATALVGTLGGNLSGIIRATATGGGGETSTHTAIADASATGIAGGLTASNFSGRVEVAATGGTVASSGSAHADATADGIIGSAASITGGTNAVVTVSATAGTVNGIENDGVATATGIASSGDLTLNLTSGSIIARAVGTTASATALSAVNEINLDLASGNIIAETNGAGATAISASLGSIAFGDVNVIGEIAGGTSTLTVSGDTTIWGDITSTGDAMVSEDASLTFLKPESVLGGNLTVSSNATLGVMLTTADTYATALAVSGTVTIVETGALDVTISATSAGGSVLSNSYLAVGSSGVTGEFDEVSSDLFILSSTNKADGVWVTIDGVVKQVGEGTPAVANAMRALSRTGLGLMADISSRTEGIRTLVRDPKSNATPVGTLGPDVSGSASGKWTVYLHQINHIGQQDEEDGVDGYDFHSLGLLLGLEKVINEKFLIGGSAGYLGSRFAGDISAQEGTSDLIAANLYGNWIKDAWHFGAGLTFAVSGTDTERKDTGGTSYSGDFDSSYLGGWMDGGYSIIKDSMRIEPYGRLAYLGAEHDGYTDSGGSVTLTVGDNSVDNLATELGLRVGKTWHRKRNNDEVELTVKIGWLHEWLDNQVAINNAAIGGVAQIFESADSSPGALVLGITENWFISDQWSVSLSYEPVISDGWYYHNLSGHLNYRF
ncbi:MAG: autotransporter domain-containing protein [Verrucomicrobiota bacterium]